MAAFAPPLVAVELGSRADSPVECPCSPQGPALPLAIAAAGHRRRQDAFLSPQPNNPPVCSPPSLSVVAMLARKLQRLQPFFVSYRCYFNFPARRPQDAPLTLPPLRACRAPERASPSRVCTATSVCRYPRPERLPFRRVSKGRLEGGSRPLLHVASRRLGRISIASCPRPTRPALALFCSLLARFSCGRCPGQLSLAIPGCFGVCCCNAEDFQKKAFAMLQCSEMASKALSSQQRHGSRVRRDDARVPHKTGG